MIKMKIYKSYSKYGCSTILMAFFVISVQILWSLPHGAGALQCFNCYLDDLDPEYIQPSSKTPIYSLIKKTVFNHYKPADIKLFVPCPERFHDDEKQNGAYYAKELKWKNKQFEELPCPESSKCSVGHFIIKDSHEKALGRGTVMGCASKELIKKIDELGKDECAPESIAEKNQEGKVLRNLTIHHCNKESEFCSIDFCISPREAYIRRDPLKETSTSSSFGIFENMAVFASVLTLGFLAVFFIGLVLKLCLCNKNICSCCRHQKQKEAPGRQRRKHCSIEESD